MASPVNVLLSFIPGRFEELREFGREHKMHSKKGTLKNGTIARNMVDFILDMRHDPTIARIVEREHIPVLSLIEKAMSEYAKRNET